MGATIRASVSLTEERRAKIIYCGHETQCVCGGGITSCNLLVVIPASLAMALPIAQHRTDRVASHSDPCSSDKGVQNHSADKNEKSHEFLQAKSKIRNAWWNVRTLGSLSVQSAQLLATIDTVNKKKIALLALSETRWSGHGICSTI